jgi:tetratricopeptide (TPR) repeat protein
MKKKVELTDLLTQYMQAANYGSRRLAKRINQLFGRPHFLHRGTIDNWVAGRAKTVRDWRQLVAVAAALGLGEAQTNDLLHAAKLPNIHDLWAEANDADQLFLKRIPLSTNSTPSAGSGQVVLQPGFLPPGSHLPLRANPLFVGREAELDRLAQLFQEQRMITVVLMIAITGLGGMGKTQLAVEFAYRHGRDFPGGIFWFGFANDQAIATEMAACGGANGLALRADFDDLPQPEQIKLVHRAWQEPIPRLLIFDACEEEALLGQWQPTSGGCCLLITSRRGRWDPALGVTPLFLNILPRLKSVALLQKLQSDLTEEDASAIAAELGDLPLALHLAGSFLAYYQYEVSPAAYLAQLQALQGQALLNHPSLQGRGATYRPTGHELHVTRSFALSYERLQPQREERDALAQALLVRAAYFAPGEPIPRALLRVTITNARNETESLLLTDGVGRLVALGLVQEGVEGGVQLHPLLAEFVKGVAADREARRSVEEALITMAAQLNERHSPVPLRPIQTHLRYVTEQAEDRADEWSARLDNELGHYLLLTADYAQAKVYLERAVALFKQIVGEAHPDMAMGLNNLGTLLQAMGEYEAAQPYFEQALAINETVLGKQHPHTAMSLNNLAVLLRETEQHEAARPYFERALAIAEQVLGKEHPHTALTLHNLGVLLHGMGEHEAAKPYLERSLTIAEQALGTEHPGVAYPLKSLGLLFKDMGCLNKAYVCLERALTIRQQSLGPEHPHTALSLNHLGQLLQVMGKLAEAQAYLEQALVIQKKPLGIGTSGEDKQ